jgi:hypothetical protein
LKKNLGGKMKLIAREEFIDGVKRVYKNTPEDEIKYDMYLRVLQELSKQQVSIIGII